MSERTTLAERLATVFAELHEAIPASAGSGKTLFQAWESVLGSSGADGLVIIGRIGLIANGVLHLQQQVNIGARLTPSSKIAAKETIGSSKSLLRVDLINQDGTSLRGNCSPLLCGYLSMLGTGLEAEFSETRVDEASLDEIAAAIEELEILVRESSIPLNLKLSLSRLLRTMQWLVTHPDIAGPQDLFEICGAALVVSRQIKDTNTKADSGDAQSIEVTIWTQMVGIGSKIARFVGWADKTVAAGQQLTHDAQRLLETLGKF